MWPDRVSNPGPLTYESDALPTAQLGPDTRARMDGYNVNSISAITGRLEFDSDRLCNGTR